MDQLLEEAYKDPSVLSCSLNIQELLNQRMVDHDSSLEGKTLTFFLKENVSVLNDLECSLAEKEIMCDKLKDYRYIDRICDLIPGRHVRWIDPSNGILKKGGHLVKVEIHHEKVYLLYRNFKYFNKCALNSSVLLFQKFTVEEQLYLMLQENGK